LSCWSQRLRQRSSVSWRDVLPPQLELREA
jgi:hypothetical protein